MARGRTCPHRSRGAARTLGAATALGASAACLIGAPSLGAPPASTAAPTQSAPTPPPLVIPPVPEVPGANAIPEEDPDEVAAREAAREAEAKASPRRSISAPHRGRPAGPPVPPAPVRQRQMMNLVPVEPGIADRNALSQAMRVMPYEMRNPSGFMTLYSVDDRPDVMVRGNGAVYAVFPHGDYALATVQRRRVVQTLVPAGTVYYIGEPNWRSIWLPGVRPSTRAETAEEVAAHTPPATAVQRVEPTMPYDYDGVYLAPFAYDEHPDYAAVDTRIDTWIGPSERAFAPPPAPAPLREGPAPERPVGAAPANSEKASPVDERTEPPIISDPVYRRQRMKELLGQAAQRTGVR